MARFYPFEVLFYNGEDTDPNFRWMNLLCKNMEEVKREIETFGVEQLVYIKEYVE